MFSQCTHVLYARGMFREANGLREPTRVLETHSKFTLFSVRLQENSDPRKSFMHAECVERPSRDTFQVYSTIDIIHGIYV